VRVHGRKDTEVAVSAKFVADLSSFEDAIQRGVVRLRTFQDGISRVDKDLAKFGNQFSGTKVIADAQLAAKAVESIGGVSKLTANEQARLNSVVSEALAKYKALGLDAPKHLSDIEKATRKVDEATGGISAKMIAVGSAIGTFVGQLAVDAIKTLGREVLDLATNGIKLAPIVSSFDRLSASIGESGDEMIAVTRTATKGLIKDLDIMQSANKAILLGLPVTANEFGTLASAATALGKAMGQDATKSLDDLITALGRSSPLILDNLGLTVKVGEANEAYARSVKRSANDLTDAEKKLAFYNAAVDAAKVKMEALGGVQLTLADQITRLRNGFQNFTDALGVAIARSPVLNELLGAFAGSVEDAFGKNQTDRVQLFIRAINQSAIAIVDFGVSAIDVAASVHDAYRTMAEAVSLDVSSMAKGMLNTMRGSVDALIGVALALQRFDPTGIAERNLKLLVATRAAMTANTHTNEGFGRTLDGASQQLKALRDRLIDSSRAQVAAADIAADLTKRTNDLAGSSKEAAKVSDALFGRDVIEKANQYAAAIGNISNVQRLSLEKQREVSKVVTEALETYQRLGKVAPPALVELSKATAMVQARSVDFALAMRAVPPDMELISDAATKTVRRLQGFTDDGLLPSARALDLTAEQIYAIPPALRNMDASLQKSTGILGMFKDGLGDIWKGMSGGKGISGVFENLGQGVIEGFGNLISGGITSLVNKGIELAWAGIKKLGGLIKGLFGGPDQDELDARTVVRGFEDQVSKLLTQQQRLEAGTDRWKQTLLAVQDAYLATGRTAEDALRDVGALYEASRDNAEAATRAVQLLNEAFMEQEADTERLNAAIEKYGFTIEELGPTFRNQRLTEQAKELIEDWRVLVASGINVATVNERMAESLNDYLQTALKTGSEVPLAMRPILEAMVNQGSLLDANGNAITNLQDAGITFSETLTQGFDRVIAKLQVLIDTLQGAGHAISDLPAVNIPVTFDEPTGGGFLSRFRGLRVNEMAAGGSGMVSQPTLFMAGEAGPEQYAFSGAHKKFDAAPPVDMAGVEDRLDRVERRLGDLPRAIRIAMQDAMALA
jgi:hypothetical protein